MSEWSLLTLGSSTCTVECSMAELMITAEDTRQNPVKIDKRPIKNLPMSVQMLYFSSIFLKINVSMVVIISPWHGNVHVARLCVCPCIDLMAMATYIPQVLRASKDAPSQYIATMSCIFAAQKNVCVQMHVCVCVYVLCVCV